MKERIGAHPHRSYSEKYYSDKGCLPLGAFVTCQEKQSRHIQYRRHDLCETRIEDGRPCLFYNAEDRC